MFTPILGWHVFRRRISFTANYYLISWLPRVLGGLFLHRSNRVLLSTFDTTTNVIFDCCCRSCLIHHTEAPPSQAHNAIDSAMGAIAASPYTNMFSLMSVISQARRKPLTPWLYCWKCRMRYAISHWNDLFGQHWYFNCSHYAKPSCTSTSFSNCVTRRIISIIKVWEL